MDTKTTVAAIACLLALAGAFFAGRASKNPPPVSLPTEAEKGPETKPLVPDTVFLPRLGGSIGVLPRVDTVWQGDTLWRAETLYVAEKGFKPVVFGNRWPHTGDSAIVWGRDSLTLIPFGFVPQEAPIEAKTGLGRQPLLEVGAVWSWGGNDLFFASVPNLARDRRLLYTPHRIGVTFQPYQRRWGLVVSWNAL